jgi:hypothetical protein
MAVLKIGDQSFSPSDIKWIKNIDNKYGTAYLDVAGDFDLHHSNRGSLDKISYGDIVILYQYIDGQPCFTHLITPKKSKTKEIDDNEKHPFVRRVTNIAVLNKESAVNRKETTWSNFDFTEIGQVGVKELRTVNALKDLTLFQNETWNLFASFFPREEIKQFSQNIERAIAKYKKRLETSEWIGAESYKFEFANYIHENIDWNQTDEQILSLLEHSQKIKYSYTPSERPVRGVNFMLVSGRYKPGEIINLENVANLRRIQNQNAETINWENRISSFPCLSSWIATLYPDSFYPIPQTGFDETISHLFDVRNEKFPKFGMEYLIRCQQYFLETEKILKQYLFEEPFLIRWNQFFVDHPKLNVLPKKELTKIDWVWIVQDFHLYVLRNIINKNKQKPKDIPVQDEDEPTTVEGNSRLATHMRRERDYKFIRDIKAKALLKNKMLNCEVCGFSFLEFYGEIGAGFIEAHHKNPLSEQEGEFETKASDIALVCSNCHRMLHKGNPVYSIEQLKEMIS